MKREHIIMPNNFFCKSISASIIIFFSAPAFADDLSKDSWLNSVKEFAPAGVCKSFMEDKELSKRLEKIKIDYDKCLTLIPLSFDKCQTKYYSQIPNTITKADAEKWGNKLGACIGGDFTVNYLFPKSSR